MNTTMADKFRAAFAKTAPSGDGGGDAGQSDGVSATPERSDNH